MPERILVVDDDEDTTSLVKMILEREGFQALIAHSGPDAMRLLFEHRPDAVLLDVMMPDMDGFEAARRIRQVANIPILMLTAKVMEEDAVRGLSLGADDYIRKPFHPQELIARLRAQLRRARSGAAGGEREVLAFDGGTLTIDAEAQRVNVNGREVSLTPTEFRLLLLLARNAGRVLSSATLSGELSESDETNAQGIRWFVWKLRGKIEPDPGNPRFIRTVHGVGYRFEG
jgi:two-component system KDP operon response regulator KdpE